MDSVSANFNNTEEQKPIFTHAGDPHVTTTTDSFGFAGLSNSGNNHEGILSSMTPMMHGLRGNELLNMLAQQEPKVADSAPSGPDMDLFTNIRLNGTEVLNDDTNLNSNIFSGYNPSESSGASIWPDTNSQNSKSNEMMDTFDFLAKSISSANQYLSSLTRDQLSVLRSIRPSLLHEFLQEVAKARSDRRMRRAYPNECAFCKNNGENEECYSSHALKDWRGRVLCPVLRAFRCPRCGATGDRAHTIKYCPDGAGVTGSLASRRRVQPSSLLMNGSEVGSTRSQMSEPGTPAILSPGTTSSNSALTSLSSLWANFGLN
ncbi:unnamed protein product [Chrysodeixis includens]|uniref:Nanos-type domain-containing protein n=1 Tax=Chrysodeixis includens TaxID=689277 RepID=A0A9P0BQW2_CHRIL|nr:unnamed protein product [Chrysodeixis includens]